MDPFTLSILAAVAVAIAVPITVVFTLRFLKNIVEWFREKAHLVASTIFSKRRVAIGIKDKLKSGDYSYVQGIFDLDSETLVDAKKYKAKELDNELLETHRRKDLVVYQ